MNAKKFAAIILCAAMTAASVLSVGAAEENIEAAGSNTVETTAVENTETAGSGNSEIAAVDSTVVTKNVGEWKLIPNAGIGYLSEDEDSMLQKAFEGSDNTFSGVALLGSQVVSGTNYAFLGQTSIDGKSAWAIAIVYQDLKGNVSLTSVKAIDLSKYIEKSSDINFEQLAGGWTVTETQFELKDYDEETADNSSNEGSADDATKAPSETAADAEASKAAAAQSQISEDTAKAFAAATKELVGVSYGPIAEIALQQTDSDTNYAILCKATSVTAEPASGLAIVVINKDADGNCTVSSIAGLDLTDYAE